MTGSNVNFTSTIEKYTREFFVLHHVEDYCGGKRCAGISFYKQVGTSVVTHSNFYECSYNSEY
jgi:hypothetical protein